MRNLARWSMSLSGQTRKSDCTIAMSAFPPLATRQRTSPKVRFVPIAEVIRSSSRQADHLAVMSFGQPGLPQSFLVSREVLGTPIRAQHVFESGNS